MNKVRWGILGAAKIGIEKVIPAMQQGKYGEVVAIASREEDKARAAAMRLGIGKAYGSYEALLEDESIDAVYIPLPNHLHVPWSLKALAAGKHVLCEKPVALSSAEAQVLLYASAKYPRLKIMEAFMYRLHPQWQEARELVRSGRIGELRTIQAFFSYYNADPANIRNQQSTGGGGLMDIGCYCISQSRYIFEKEPVTARGWIDYDPVLKTDRMASAILDFGTGTSTFTCSTQLFPFQRFHIFGTTGRIEIEVPVNAAPDTESRIWLHEKSGPTEFRFAPCNQYTLQADSFCEAILNDTPVIVDLEDAVKNLRVMESIVKQV